MENLTTTTKKTGTKKVGPWDLRFEWESANEAKPAGIRVTGNNNTGGFFNSDISTANSHVGFGGGVPFTADIIPVLESVIETVAEINASYEPTT